MLCYRHHPDYAGKKPAHELIHRLHAEHKERRAAIHGKLSEIHRYLEGMGADKLAPPQDGSSTEAGRAPGHL